MSEKRLRFPVISATDFQNLYEESQRKLSDIRLQDQMSGTITGLSYVELELEEREGWIVLRAFNRGFTADSEPSAEVLGYVRDQEGGLRPLVLVNESPGIVSGTMGLDGLMEALEHSSDYVEASPELPFAADRAVSVVSVKSPDLGL